MERTAKRSENALPSLSLQKQWTYERQFTGWPFDPAIKRKETMDEILKYRTAPFLGSLTSVSQEGFNNKVGWLTQQTYDYRDEQYLYLKIYDLPHLPTRRDLWDANSEKNIF